MMNNANFSPFERNRYFYGKLLTVRDFETEQRYCTGKRSLLNRVVTGAGVVCGLGVMASDESTLMIGSGMALDYQGREIDAVIELPDGQWCAFEIKLGANQIDGAAAGLLRLQQEFAADPKGKPPAVLCVLCGMSGAAYRRPDGVFVVPVTALKN